MGYYFVIGNHFGQYHNIYLNHVHLACKYFGNVDHK